MVREQERKADRQRLALVIKKMDVSLYPPWKAEPNNPNK